MTESKRSTAKGMQRRNDSYDSTCLVCERHVSTRQQRHCKLCLPKVLQELRGHVKEVSQRAARAREKLAGEIERRDKSDRSRPQATRSLTGAAILQDRCSSIRDQIFEGRIDAADLRFQQLEAQRRLEQAWMTLSQKHDHILENVLFSTERRLHGLLAEKVSELAMQRAQKVHEVVKLFQVKVTSTCAEIQGLPCPRKRNDAECNAMAQLSRLTVLIAKYLSVSLPFRVDVRPSHCVIYGGGKEGGREYPLSSPPNGNEIVDDEQWARHHRHALYLLAMNVRHMAVGTEEEELYLKICATNDVSPLAIIRNILAICAQTRLGYGEAMSCEYAYEEERRFALNTVRNDIVILDPATSEPSAMAKRRASGGGKEGKEEAAAGVAVEAGGELQFGDGTDWAIVLPPPPSETPDF
ncbi:hypothetical protein GUITHDRAFT_145071 [Guillardia theta CCMP2712]|uniref:Uncharacterized protein n=1 Tax=Guillardia theta (strain CCMP2712) TaxID=905079 RepID=L1INA7_GUITC|nr:hypothetical protein GUITHDRAFT_145071 [Guillardia theta CCMP2712]EKX37374.1 hypothetical protein GUITHDRAFT_145071 [Guillardia theta CCMP2712]|eukprot:XP_005824354.1 hypothetical protein GUITHDRAFT_145071 [Guillardia theta CCMP2712]